MGNKRRQISKAIKKKDKAYEKLSTQRYQLTLQQRTSLKNEIAQSLTKLSTRSERVLRKRIVPLGFRQNAVVLGFIPDFVHAFRKVIVEVDGPIHSDPKIRDRDEYKNSVFEREGYTVIRFFNHEVLNKLDYVVSVIKLAVEGKYEGEHEKVRVQEPKAKKERTRAKEIQAKTPVYHRHDKLRNKPKKGPKVVKEDGVWLRMPEPRSMLSSKEYIVVIPPKKLASAG
jgi:very-short-patch-repair endonuclease